MNDHDIAARIIGMKDADLALRQKLLQSGELGPGYHPAMEALHRQHAEILEAIIDETGYPGADRVGPEAADAAWLIIQHAIGQPGFMRKCHALLRDAVERQSADPLHLACLSDRIAVFEDRPQMYGTQFDWDEAGEMSPAPVDDELLVDLRRRSLGLHTLAEQTARMRARVAEEDQRPPENHAQRKAEADAWRKRVGWI